MRHSKIFWFRLKSYEGTESSGLVRIVGMDDTSELKGRNVLVVEVCFSIDFAILFFRALVQLDNLLLLVRIRLRSGPFGPEFCSMTILLPAIRL